MSAPTRRAPLSPPREPRPLKLPPADVAPHPDAERVWRDVVARLAELGVPDHAIANWIEPAAPIGVRAGALCIAAPQAAANWIRRRYPSICGELIRDEGTFTGLLVYDRPTAGERPS